MSDYSWAHFFAIGVAFLAIALIVGFAAWAHSDAAVRIYSAVQLAHHNGSNASAFFNEDLTTTTLPGYKNSQLLMALGKEGARWAHDARCEATMWAIVIAVLVFLMLGYHYWLSRKM